MLTWPGQGASASFRTRGHARAIAVEGRPTWTDGLLQPMCRNPDMSSGELRRLLDIPQPDRGNDGAMLGHRSVQAAAQGQRTRLESPYFTGQPVVYLKQLRVAAQLAEQLVKRHVRCDEVRDGACLGMLGHFGHQFVEPGQAGIGDLRHGKSYGQDLQRFSDLVR